MLHPPIKTIVEDSAGLIGFEFAQNDKCEKWIKKWNDNSHKRKEASCQICEDIKEVQKCWTLPQTISKTYYVRGAVSWPTGVNPGYALVSGQDIITKRIWIYGESPFWHVQNMEMAKGIWHFFQKMWNTFKCQRYFYSDQKEHRRFSIQVQRETLLKNKPAFIEAKYASDSQGNADALMKEFIKNGRIRVDEDFLINGIEGNLGRQTRGYVDGLPIDEDRLPAVKALRALICGFERMPYRENTEPQRCPEPYF